jgi:hypothetical protein
VFGHRRRRTFAGTFSQPGRVHSSRGKALQGDDESSIGTATEYDCDDYENVESNHVLTTGQQMNQI